MVRTLRDIVEPDALSYTSADWLRFGNVAEPTTRQKLILLAIEEIIAHGPADFSAYRVCDRLGIKHPNVNYNFGGRDGLIAEATWWSFQDWSRRVIDAWRLAPRVPLVRLRTGIEAEIANSRRLGAMNLLMHYPLASQGAAQELLRVHGDELQKIRQLHFATLAITVRDIRRGTLSALDLDADSLPLRELAESPDVLDVSSQIQWMTHGIVMSMFDHTTNHNDRVGGLISGPGETSLGGFFDVIERVATLEL